MISGVSARTYHDHVELMITEISCDKRTISPDQAELVIIHTGISQGLANFVISEVMCEVSTMIRQKL